MFTTYPLLIGGVHGMNNISGVVQYLTADFYQ